MNYWKDKTVVVTGGSNGVGRELALNFARNQAFVFVLARNEARLQLMAEEALLEGLQIGWRVADVTDDQSVQDAVTGIIRRRGAIDVWINNVAAIAVMVTTTAMKQEEVVAVALEVAISAIATTATVKVDDVSKKKK